MSTVNQKILNKLNHIESLQKELLEDWHQMEDILAEISSPTLKRQIRQARKNYQKGKFVPYENLRKELDLA